MLNMHFADIFYLNLTRTIIENITQIYKFLVYFRLPLWLFHNPKGDKNIYPNDMSTFYS